MYVRVCVRLCLPTMPTTSLSQTSIPLKKHKPALCHRTFLRALIYADTRRRDPSVSLAGTGVGGAPGQH